MDDMFDTAFDEGHGGTRALETTMHSTYEREDGGEKYTDTIRMSMVYYRESGHPTNVLYLTMIDGESGEELTTNFPENFAVHMRDVLTALIDDDEDTLKGLSDNGNLQPPYDGYEG